MFDHDNAERLLSRAYISLTPTLSSGVERLLLAAAMHLRIVNHEISSILQVFHMAFLKRSMLLMPATKRIQKGKRAFDDERPTEFLSLAFKQSLI